jgi:putative N6-adenine-specific DNA methylase
MRSERIFAACTPGLEPVLARELASLGLDARAVPGGAEAEGDDACALACVGSRVADAVFLRVYDGPASGRSRARREAAARYGSAIALVARTDAGRATLSLDAAGAPLYRRGWRARVGAAPLRESLAAGILLACGYDGDRPFLDPMCGSGTLAIEAALLAARRPPGEGRDFAFERLPGHDPARTARVRARLAANVRPVPVAIHASDRNAGALRLAQKNAAAAGLADAIRFARADAAQAIPPVGPGLLATNPPYGIRLRPEDGLRESWIALGTLIARLHGWDVAVLGPDRGLEQLLPVAPVESLRVRNGGIPCRLLLVRP